LAVIAEETAAQPLAVTNAGFSGDFLNRQPSLIERVSGGLKAKILDRPHRRLTGFQAKHAAKLPGG